MAMCLCGTRTNLVAAKKLQMLTEITLNIFFFGLKAPYTLWTAQPSQYPNSHVPNYQNSYK